MQLHPVTCNLCKACVPVPQFHQWLSRRRMNNPALNLLTGRSYSVTFLAHPGRDQTGRLANSFVWFQRTPRTPDHRPHIHLPSTAHASPKRAVCHTAAPDLEEAHPAWLNASRSPSGTHFRTVGADGLGVPGSCIGTATNPPDRAPRSEDGAAICTVLASLLHCRTSTIDVNDHSP